MKEIFTAFSKAQSQFKKAIKDGKNPHFNSKYASIESYIEAIQGAFSDNQLAFMQPISSNEGKYYIQTILIHPSGEKIESPATEIILQDKNNPQKFGSSLTYFRRYSLMSFFGIPDSEDDDGNAASSNGHFIEDKKEPMKVKNYAPQSQKEIEDHKHQNLDWKTFTFSFGKFNGKRFDEIPDKQLHGYLEFLKSKSPDGKHSDNLIKIMALYSQYLSDKSESQNQASDIPDLPPFPPDEMPF